MLIYVLLVGLIFFLNFLRMNGTITNKQYCITIGIAMIIVTGLRHNDVGSDTTVYYLGFNELKNISFNELLTRDKRDFGYYILAWIVAHTSGDFVVITLLTAVIFYVPISILISKYSDDCGMSYLVLMAFNFFQFSMTGIRQTMALGFAIMFLLESLKEHPKRFRLVFLFLLGTAFHRSCLIMIVVYLVRYIKTYKFVMWMSIISIPIVFFTRKPLAGFLMQILPTIGFYDYTMAFSGESGGGTTTFAVYVILLLWGIVFAHKGRQKNEMPVVYITIMSIATALQCLVFVNSIFFRIVWYFSIFMIVYIPKLITTTQFTVRSENMARTAVYAGVLMMYYFITIGSANVLPYKFFW